MLKIIIPHQFPGLNDYIKAINTDRHVGNKMKQECTEIANYCSHQAYLSNSLLAGEVIKYNKVFVTFHWIEPNKKRDKDNIAFAKKFILDGLVEAGVIPNDSWKYVEGFKDEFSIDKENPRIEIIIKEI